MHINKAIKRQVYMDRETDNWNRQIDRERDRQLIFSANGYVRESAHRISRKKRLEDINIWTMQTTETLPEKNKLETWAHTW